MALFKRLTFKRLSAVAFSVLLATFASAAMAVPVRCDDSLKDSFKPDAQTRVTQVAAFRKGEDLASVLEPGKAAENLCMVRLLVGPANPGPADAPSTSPGIGVEIWLPSAANWNSRVLVLGGGGYAARLGPQAPPSRAAGEKGYVSAITDAGHAPFIGRAFDMARYQDASFLFAPDGRVDPFQWAGFGHRGIHEAAVKGKALAKFYYGSPAKSSYYEGASNGGRQGYVAAQTYPEDFDGIVAGAPAINWAQFLVSDIYPQTVMLRDLGRPLTPDQLNLVTSASIKACDSTVNGEHDGYITDLAACRYDPVRDSAVLCVADGGSNPTPACVTRREAAVVNKIWYGFTSDGSAPDPVIDNGYGVKLAPKQLWFGLPRGVNLPEMVVGSKDGKAMPAGIAQAAVAVALQDTRFAPPFVRNAAGNGQDRWQELTYADLSRAIAEGIALQRKFGPFYGDDPDLSAFKARGGKLLTLHGVKDQIIPVAGTRHYYARATEAMGGLDAVRSFYRYYEVPGRDHGILVVGWTEGTAPPATLMSDMSMPTSMLDIMVDWVENGRTPGPIVSASLDGTKTRPLCPYPSRVVYTGGDKGRAESYACR